MKKLFSLYLCAVGVVAANAASPLYFNSKDGSRSFDWSQLTRITFPDGNVVVELGSDQTLSATDADFVSISLQAEVAQSSIETVEATAEQTSEIFDVMGRRVSSTPRQGIYLQRVGNQTVKFMKR
jgi:3-oxoacyl-[acyl-carrier-protein] synthase III